MKKSELSPRQTWSAVGSMALCVSMLGAGFGGSFEAVYEAVHWLIQTGRCGCRSHHN